MTGFSDKTILILFILAVAVTVSSTLVTLNKLGYVHLGGNFLTGAAVSSAAGEANLTITAVTSITIQNTSVNFGSGYVNASCNFCQMDSNNTVVQHYANGSNITTNGGVGQCCVTFPSVPSGFLLENTGNVNISVGYTCAGNCTHDQLIGGTRAPTMGGLMIKVTPNSQRRQQGESGSNDSVDSCPGGGYYKNVGWNISNSSAWYGGAISNAGVGSGTYVVLGPSGHWLCGNQTHYPLAADNSQDAAVIDINITIPNDAIGTGVRRSINFTFNATSSA